MKLVLSVSAFGERAEGRCPWVWIDLSPTLAQKALRRIHTVRCAEANDDELIESHFTSGEGTFFNPWLAAAETEQEEEGVTIEHLLGAVGADTRGWAEVPQQFTVPEWAIVRMEATQMIVRADYVAFVGIPKGTGTFVATWELPVTVLKLAAQLPT